MGTCVRYSEFEKERHSEKSIRGIRQILQPPFFFPFCGLYPSYPPFTNFIYEQHINYGIIFCLDIYKQINNFRNLKHIIMTGQIIFLLYSQVLFSTTGKEIKKKKKHAMRYLLSVTTAKYMFVCHLFLDRRILRAQEGVKRHPLRRCYHCSLQEVFSYFTELNATGDLFCYDRSSSIFLKKHYINIFNIILF